MSRILPILFNANMVKTISDGRKTVTRRVVKPGWRDDESGFQVCRNTANPNDWYVEKVDENEIGFDNTRYINPPYRPGDILYIRETWQYLYELDGNEEIIENTGKYYYAATDILPTGGYVDSRGITQETVPWRPSIHMPKEAARIWLKVTDVRIEHLQDIDDNGILKEGLEIGCYFEDIWNSTIKKSDLVKYGWEANPWVWVIGFEQCERPEEG